MKTLLLYFLVIVCRLQHVKSHAMGWGYSVSNYDSVAATADVTIYSFSYHNPEELGSYTSIGGDGKYEGLSTQGKVALTKEPYTSANEFEWDGVYAWNAALFEPLKTCFFISDGLAFSGSAAEIGYDNSIMQKVTINGLTAGKYYLSYSPTSAFTDVYNPLSKIANGIYIQIFFDSTSRDAFAGPMAEISTSSILADLTSAPSISFRPTTSRPTYAPSISFQPTTSVPTKVPISTFPTNVGSTSATVDLTGISVTGDSGTVETLFPASNVPCQKIVAFEFNAVGMTYANGRWFRELSIVVRNVNTNQNIDSWGINSVSATRNSFPHPYTEIDNQPVNPGLFYFVAGTPYLMSDSHSIRFQATYGGSSTFGSGSYLKVYYETCQPTFSPTDSPSTAPTDSPSTAPTDSPSTAPTDSPSTAPTAPTYSPSSAPTESTFLPTSSLLVASSPKKKNGANKGNVKASVKSTRVPSTKKLKVKVKVIVPTPKK